MLVAPKINRPRTTRSWAQTRNRFLPRMSDVPMTASMITGATPVGISLGEVAKTASESTAFAIRIAPPMRGPGGISVSAVGAKGAGGSSTDGGANGDSDIPAILQRFLPSGRAG